MAPIPVISSRQSSATSTEHATTFPTTAGAIVGILVGSILGIIALCVCAYIAKLCCSYAQALERNMRANIDATGQADIGLTTNASRSTSGSRSSKNRHGAYEKTVKESEWLTGRSRPEPSLTEHSFHRAQQVSDDHLISQSLPSRASLRSSYPETLYEIEESGSDRLTLSGCRVPVCGILPVKPATVAATTRSRPSPAPYGDKYDIPESAAPPLPDGSAPALHRNVLHAQNSRMTLRGRAASSPEAEARRLRLLQRKQDNEECSQRWSDVGAAHKSPIARPAPAADPGRPSRADVLSRESSRRLAEIEREIAKLKRTDITRRAEMELEGRRISFSPVGKAKERSRVEQWIRNTARPTLHHVPIGDGSDYLSDITTSSALEFPRWGESEASLLAPQSVALSFDPWKEEVLKNKAMRMAF